MTTTGLRMFWMAERWHCELCRNDFETANGLALFCLFLGTDYRSYSQVPMGFTR